MSSLSRTASVLAVWACLVAPPSRAFAQDVAAIPVPRYEVSAGYSFLRDISVAQDVPGVILPDAVNLPGGWYVSGTLNTNQWFGLVAEASANYKSGLEFGVDRYTFSTTARVHTFMAGPRFFHKIGRLAPYAQVLAGLAHMRLKVFLPAELPYGPWTSTSDDFAFQPGGGVTVYVTERVGVRVAGDYRCIVGWDDGPAYSNELRFLTGFTLQWGGQ